MVPGDAFDIRVSTPGGPIMPDIARILPNPPGHPHGFTLRLQIDAATPAIVPPEGTEAPVLTLRLAPQPRVCPQSFFEPYHLQKLRLRVVRRTLAPTAQEQIDEALAAAAERLPALVDAQWAPPRTDRGHRRDPPAGSELRRAGRRRSPRSSR